MSYSPLYTGGLTCYQYFLDGNDFLCRLVFDMALMSYIPKACGWALPIGTILSRSKWYLICEIEVFEIASTMQSVLSLIPLTENMVPFSLDERPVVEVYLGDPADDWWLIQPVFEHILF